MGHPIEGRINNALAPIASVVNQNYVQEARAVHALDARHFNIRRGAGAGYPGGQHRRIRAAAEILRQRFHYLACP